MSVYAIISEAANMIRYNPQLAVKWMEEARSRVMTSKEIAYYNQKVDEVNLHIENLKTKRYYNKYEVWENSKGQAPTVLKVDDYLLTYELTSAEKIEELVKHGKL